MYEKSLVQTASFNFFKSFNCSTSKFLCNFTETHQTACIKAERSSLAAILDNAIYTLYDL